MKLTRSRILIATGLLLFIGLLVYAFMPGPLLVDLAPVTRGPLRISVNEDGRTRIKDRYIVSAPIAGELFRIQLKPGDKVKAGETILTAIQPSVPQLLNPRERAQAEARLNAAGAARHQAEALVEREEANFQFATSDLKRAQGLFEIEALSQDQFELAQLQHRTAGENLRAARFAAQIANYEQRLAEAALEWFDGDGGARFELRAPVTGRVLRVFQESAIVVAPGTKLIELGDPANLEIEIDVLSIDAVQITPGARLIVEHWGGPQPLEARVRVVEPSGFTKISALGVEEQRVWVIADFVTPFEERPTLGDAYRTEARIITWEADDVVKVPTGALFRYGQDWAVFVLAEHRARLRPVTIGRRGDLEAQVLEGLQENEQVILHPGDHVSDGVAVRAR